MMERHQLLEEPESQAGPRNTRFRSGAKLGVFEEEKEGQSSCGHVNEVESGVMRPEEFSGARSHKV